MEVEPMEIEGILLELEMWLFEIQGYLAQLADFKQPLVPFLPHEIGAIGQPDCGRMVLQEGIAMSSMMAAT
ncbi:MAG: hypothetical protein WCT52_00195 [Candidatus Micrarchaeia archaeon]|jgi:hypothetical protein